MKEIQLTQGQVALVDDEDFEKVSKHKWHATRDGNTFYAKTNIGSKRIFMHRLILNAPTGMDVDHKNKNGIDNSRANIRICSRTQNQANQNSRGGTSKYKGVCWYSRERRWVSKIGFGGKKILLGYYKDEKEAARAYDIEAQKLYGDFAVLNF